VLAAEQTSLIIKNRLAGVNLFSAPFSFDHRIDEAFELLALPGIDAKPP